MTTVSGPNATSNHHHSGSVVGAPAPTSTTGLVQQLQAVLPLSGQPVGTPGPSGSSAGGGGGGGSILYDISSFDPLQAHALQLTASAGLTSLLQVPGHQQLPPGASQPHHQFQGFPAAAPGDGNSLGQISHQSIQQQQLQQQQQLITATQQLQQQQQQQTTGGAPKQQQLHQPYVFIQPQHHHQAPGSGFSVPISNPFVGSGGGGVVGGLQPIAPAGGMAPVGAGPAPLGAAAPHATLLFPAGTDPAALAASLVAHAGLSFAMPPGFPAAATNILLNAAAATNPATAAPGVAAAPNSAAVGLSYRNLAATAPESAMPVGQQQVQHQQQQHQTPIYPATLAPSSMNVDDAMNNRVRGGDGQAATGGNKRKRQLPPSAVSSSGPSIENRGRSRRGDNSAAAVAAAEAAAAAAFAEDPVPPKEASQADLARMTPSERRRYERNLREQQRSYRISQQIKELRDVLSESNVPFKPNKYSILLSVVDYIKQLQSRAIMLDAEHQKLITTIRQTNDMVNSGKAPTSTDESDNTINAASISDSGSESDMLFVQGLDYRAIFEQCPASLGIAALDGRILECNKEFQVLLGFPRDDLLKQSLFNLVRNHQDIFRAMAQMLKTAEDRTLMHPNGMDGSEGGGIPMSSDEIAKDDAPVSKDRFWTGPVTSKRDIKLLMNITLTLGDKGTPKFFSCTLTTTD